MQYIKKKDYELFIKQNPGAESKIYYDVASGKPVRLVRSVATDSYAFIPADSSEIDTSGEGMPAPEKQEGPDFTYLSPDQQKKLKEIQEEADPNFGMGFYE